ncbi:hypothetical protein [Streptomyces sp. NPDC048611]|uniref:hypothetical protein n=1 Tax=Streptomyces sp. NPDC048611 TaxID=3155635 RepID=UPI00342E72A2
MPTAIAVTSPDLALPSADRRTPAAVVLQAPQLQPLDDALTETSAVLEHHGHLVALYSAVCPPEHIRRLHTLRAVLESDRIAIVPLSLPPLGVALLARQLRQLSLCDFSPGVLASAARLLAHYVHAGALLGSVSGLDRIEVDLRAHMKSWLPGAHFAVLAHPQPQLLHLDRHSTEAGLPAPGFATELAVARGQLTSDWVTEALAPAWQVQGLYETRLPAESARWWGTQKLIEFAAAVPDVAVLHQLVSSVRREECGWCGRELLGDRCAFCASPLARERATGGGGPGQGPAAIGGITATGGSAATGGSTAIGGSTATGGSVSGPVRGGALAPTAGSASVPGAVSSAVHSAASGAVPAPDAASGGAPAPGGSPAAAPSLAQPPAPSSVQPPTPVPAPTPSSAPAPAPAPTRAPDAPDPSGSPDLPTAATTSAASPPPAGPPPSPWEERPLSPGVPDAPDAPGVVGVWGGRAGRRGEPGQLDVRGPDLSAGGQAVAGNPYGAGIPAPGNSYGSGRPVPGNPYASDTPRAPGVWDLPGHPDFAGHPDATGQPDLSGHPEVPGTPRTVARVR